MSDTVEIDVRDERIEFGDGAVHVLRGGLGPPLFFLQAAGGVGFWHAGFDRLARTFDVIVPTYPGFGDSDELPSVEAMDDLVYHVLDLLDRLGVDRPHVVGASFGGWVAAEVAVHSPERVGDLVLLSPVGLRIPGSPIADLFAMSPEQRVRALFHDPAIAAGLFPAEPDLDFILRAYRDLGGLARFGWQPYMADPKLERRLGRITARTLVAWADDDRVVPRLHAERYAEAIPNARLETIAACGHALYFEQPERIAGLITSFLSEE